MSMSEHTAHRVDSAVTDQARVQYAPRTASAQGAHAYMGMPDAATVLDGAVSFIPRHTGLSHAQYARTGDRGVSRVEVSGVDFSSVSEHCQGWNS